MIVFILNESTKDEEEEYLDYHYPQEDPELSAVLPMKGVLLASCGVMQSAVGQQVSFLLFRSAVNPKIQYKAAFQKIDHWFLCMVLPGVVSDRMAKCLVQEAASLISLRHGRLSCLQGHFRQLDSIFRALGGLLKSVGQGSSNECDIPAGNVYLSLGVVLWSSLADGWREEVQSRVMQWESRWEASHAGQRLARPEGFALLLGQTLVATSLTDEAFDACLRLLLLEGALDPGATGSTTVAGDEDVRCHCLFFGQAGEDSQGGPLPSHQYSIVQRGPWLLLMLWRMGSSTPLMGSASPAPMGSASPAPADSPLADSFGVDLCLELLQRLPLPQGQQQSSTEGPLRATSTPNLGDAATTASRDKTKVAAAAAAAATVGAAAGKEKKKGRSSLKLSCPIWKPLTRSSKPSRRNTVDLTVSSAASASSPSICRAAPPRPPRGIFLQALEMQARAPSVAGVTPSQPCAFALTRQPRNSAHDQLGASELYRVRCPELASRAAARRCQAWSTWGVSELLSDWAELDSLLIGHSLRRDAWSLGPKLATRRHALVDVFKGGGALDKLWDEVAEELGLPQGGNGAGRQTLGKGEAWRFQLGAPYYMSDVSTVRSAGIRTGIGQHRTWAAISELDPGVANQAPRRVFLQLDAMGEAS